MTARPATEAAPARGAPQVVVMGVSGCGKSTVGQALAQALGVRWVEGDALHPPANVQRMAAGVALTDDDRAQWLDRIAEALDAGAAEGVVVACSALKRRYRDRLRQAAPALRLVFLSGEPGLIGTRLAARAGHYMPPSLLPSQLQALEPPQPDEGAVVLDVGAPPGELVAAALRALRGGAATDAAGPGRAASGFAAFEPVGPGVAAAAAAGRA